MGKSAKKDKSDREKSNKGDKVKEKKDKKSLKKMKSMKSVENNNKEEEPKSLASLFETDGVKVDSTIDSLFSQPTGAAVVPKRKRTKIVIEKENVLNEETNTPESVLEKEVEIINGIEEEEKAPSKKRKRAKDVGDLEDKYMAKILNQTEKDISKLKIENENKSPLIEKEKIDNDGNSDNEIENADNKPYEKLEPLIHESIKLKEEELQKAENTVFVANLTTAVITDKLINKQFKALFEKHGKVKSVRFRSIAFSEMLPRKLAIAQLKLHPKRTAINAYVVFESKEAMRKSLELNGTEHFGTHLRVDSVAHPAKHDNKRCIFVGNLDFEIEDELLWSYFEKCGRIEYVRVVRDSTTNVGKGFGYVQFDDFTSVSKALLLNEKKLPDGRKIRISRAKNIKPPTAKQPFLNRNPKEKLNLTQTEKTTLGRAKRLLGKADRSTAGGPIIEGNRAKKGDTVAGINKNRKKGRTVKKARIRARSTDFKKKLISAKNK